LNNKFLRIAFLLVCLVSARAPAQSWSLVWADEFNQPDGSAPDSSKWGYDTGGTGWGNNELEYYTLGTTNTWIQGGQLIIEARIQNLGGRTNTSARLKTKGKWSWTRGRIEARIKIPRGQGIWPAFWTLGANIDSVNWPTCGEIDIMENIGREPGTVHGTLHGPGYSGGNGIGGPYTLPGGAAFADDFHLFAIQWETNRIQWFVDNQPYFSAATTSIPPGSNWVFNAPQFILLNVAVGGGWPGYPDSTTTFPQRMLVDYVRVYAATNLTACGSNVLANPGMESALANWHTFPGGGNTLLESVTNRFPVHNGSNVFKVYGQFNGSFNDSGMYQDYPCAPGATFTAKGWAFTQSFDRIAAANTSWFEVTFRNSASNILAVYRSQVVDTNTPPDVWIKYAVTNQFNPSTFAPMGSVSSMVAPAGTTFARGQVTFRQPQSAAGAVLWDDLNLVAGSGEAPVTSGASKNGSMVSVAFPTFLGPAYFVKYKTNLTDSAWQLLTNVAGDASLKIVSDAATQGHRFYSVTRGCN
jgi:beta-glucanase (GH16 family)